MDLDTLLDKLLDHIDVDSELARRRAFRFKSCPRMGATAFLHKRGNIYLCKMQNISSRMWNLSNKSTQTRRKLLFVPQIQNFLCADPGEFCG